MEMNLYGIVFGCLFSGIGILFLMGKGITYIDGFSSMLEEEKQEINLHLLNRLLARVFLSAGLLFLFAGLQQAFLQTAFKWFILAWFVGTGYTVYILSSKRYLGTKKAERQ